MAIIPVYVRNPQILSAPSGAGDVMIMGIETNSYYAATDVGALVWALLETPQSIPALCDAVRHAFEVDEPTCTEGVTRFVEELVTEKLVSEVRH